MNHIKIDENLAKIEEDIAKLEAECKKLQEGYETMRKKLKDMHSAKDKLIEDRNICIMQRLEDIKNERQENLKKWEEEDVKLTEEILKASNEFLPDEANYEVYKESLLLMMQTTAVYQEKKLIAKSYLQRNYLSSVRKK